jgi:hypothetical protein
MAGHLENAAEAGRKKSPKAFLSSSAAYAILRRPGREAAHINPARLHGWMDLQNLDVLKGSRHVDNHAR